VPEGLNNLPINIPVATQTLHAVGLGYAIKYRRKDDVALVFFGDGATSEGDFHEALNFAGVFQTPTIFVCQNNQWAISLPRSKQSRSETLAQKALAYGVPGIQVDGNDVLATYVAAKEAIARARSGGGPTMIENVTYRLEVHSTSDDPKRYRTDEEVQQWQKRDPLPRFQKYLMDKGLLTDAEIQALEEEIQNEIKAAVERTEEQMKELSSQPAIMFEQIYAELPPHLEAQKEELARELEQVEETHG